jgi:hypothetical protein
LALTFAVALVFGCRPSPKAEDLRLLLSLPLLLPLFAIPQHGGGICVESRI